MIVLEAADQPVHSQSLQKTRLLYIQRLLSFQPPDGVVNKNSFCPFILHSWWEITSYFLMICALNFYSMSPALLVFKKNYIFHRIFETLPGQLQHSWGCLKQKTSTAKKFFLDLFLILIVHPLGLINCIAGKTSRRTRAFCQLFPLGYHLLLQENEILTLPWQEVSVCRCPQLVLITSELTPATEAGC